MPREKWMTISEFPLYAVSDQGRVMNRNTDQIKVINYNQSGQAHVLVSSTGEQPTRRAVARLVAEAFLPVPEREDFNTPIHLNGDRTDCRADNLMWRPRWFAVSYHKQFRPGGLRGFKEPVMEMESGETFDTSWDAAVKYGLIDRQILISTMNNTYVFPTAQRFRTMRE